MVVPTGSRLSRRGVANRACPRAGKAVMPSDPGPTRVEPQGVSLYPFLMCLVCLKRCCYLTLLELIGLLVAPAPAAVVRRLVGVEI